MDDLKDLHLRRNLALGVLRMIREDLAYDPRSSVAEQRYMKQLEEIEEKIKEISGRPPDVVIGLSPANLFAKKI